MDDTLELIKLRVAKSYMQMKISKSEAKSWDPEQVSAKDMATLIYQLYADQQRTETTVQIKNAINQFNFGFDLADKQVEEISHQNIVKLIADHYGSIDMISVETQDHIAKLIYRKVPNNSELNRMFKDQTKEEIALTNNKDSILGCLNRYADVIQQTRAIHDKAVAHRIASNSFYSGATIERQSATSSSNTTISYGTTTNATATAAKDPKRSLKTMPHDTDFHEGNRKVSNRCETCGMTNHLRRECLLFGNKVCNNTSTMWHFSPIGRAWFTVDLHCFTRDITLEGWGQAQWAQTGPPPNNHTYPDEISPTNELIHRESQLSAIAPKFKNKNKYNHIANRDHPVVSDKSHYNNRNAYIKYTDNNRNDNRNQGYNNEDPDQHGQTNDSKKPRRELIQYVAAVIKTVTPKLLPVRLYLNMKGTTATTAIVIATTGKTGAEAIATTRATITPVKIIPEQGLPDPANTAKAANAAQVHTATAGNRRVAKTEALLDSGALAGNFINTETLTLLKGTHMLRAADERIIVCSGLDNKCLASNVMLDITFEFDAANKTYAIDIPVRISNNSPLGCIIGIDTIKKFNIVQLVPHFFLSEEAIDALRTNLKMDPNKDRKRKHIEIVSEDPHQDTPLDTSRIHKCPTGCDGCTSDGVAKLPDIVEPVQITTIKAVRAQQPRTVRSVRFDDTPLGKSVEVITLPLTEPALAQTSRPIAVLIREVDQLLEV